MSIVNNEVSYVSNFIQRVDCMSSALTTKRENKTKGKTEDIRKLWKVLVTTIMLIEVMVSQISVQFSSVSQSCLTLCDPMNHSTPDLPVHHQLPESTQTHVHYVGDSIQPSHPLSSPSPSALNLS